MAASWTKCEEFIDEPCKIYKELFYTQNLGEQWNFISNYVFDFEWGITAKTIANSDIDCPESRVFVTKENSSQNGHQVVGGRRGKWNHAISLYVSDDFKNWEELLKGANTLIKTDSYMFVTKATAGLGKNYFLYTPINTCFIHV